MTLIIEIAVGVFAGIYLLPEILMAVTRDRYETKSDKLPIEREYTFKIIGGVCRKVYVDEVGRFPIERERKYTFKIIDGVCRKVYEDEFNA